MTHRGSFPVSIAAMLGTVYDPSLYAGWTFPIFFIFGVSASQNKSYPMLSKTINVLGVEGGNVRFSNPYTSPFSIVRAPSHYKQ